MKASYLIASLVFLLALGVVVLSLAFPNEKTPKKVGLTEAQKTVSALRTGRMVPTVVQTTTDVPQCLLEKTEYEGVTRTLNSEVACYTDVTVTNNGVTSQAVRVLWTPANVPAGNHMVVGHTKGEDGAPFAYTIVQVWSPDENGSLITQMQEDETGGFSFVLPDHHQYVLRVVQDGYSFNPSRLLIPDLSFDIYYRVTVGTTGYFTPGPTWCAPQPCAIPSPSPSPTPVPSPSPSPTPVPVTSLNVEPNSVTLRVGQCKQFTLTDQLGRPVVGNWLSNNPIQLTVSNGLACYVKKGTAKSTTIYASSGKLESDRARITLK
jgi:cell division septation protein DedD